MTDPPPFMFPPDLDYPVSLAIYHAVNNHSPTPVSGDLKSMTYSDRKAYRELELEDHYQNTY